MIRSIVSILTAAGISGAAFVTPLSAAPIFPPPHLDYRAAFAAGAPSSTVSADAWYHAGESVVRAARIAADTPQASPYPAVYYFHRVRNYANDESAELRHYEHTSRGSEGRMADANDAVNDAS